MSWMAGMLFASVVGAVAPDTTCPGCGDAGAEREQPEATLELGGAIRFNYQYKDWERESFDLRDAGQFEFDTFRLNADGTYGDLRFSTEYRFYAGYHMIHHGWVGYVFSDRLAIQAGVHKVPFGPLPYASHNWFFQLPYYVGLEDDYDAGVKLIYAPGPWDVRLAFYKNDEGSYTGNTLASARYSYDVVPVRVEELEYAGLTEGRSNRETNQFNARVTRTLDHGEASSTELGVSGQWGQLRNGETGRFGSHWAAGVHVNATHHRWNLIAEAMRYEMHPANPTGVDDRFVVMGAYDAPYKVASEANLLLAGLAYTLPVSWGPIESVQFYNDYTFMDKSASGYESTQQNVLGAAFASGPLYVYMDVASGKNHPWLGPNYGAALAEGAPGSGWNTRFNINLGYYF